jgi:non-ribosomal peptide synthetase component E (peptide arylation enzyme)
MDERQDTFPRLLLRHARVRPDHPATREKDLGIWQTWTWREVADEVRSLACGLAADGFKRGMHLAIVGDNRPRLYWAMIAAQAWSIVNFTDEIVDKSEIIYFPEFADAKYKTSEFTVGGVNNSFVINKASYNDPAKHDQLVKMLDEVCGEAVYQKWIDTGAMTSRAAKFDYSKSPKLFSKVNDFVAPLKGQTNFWILMPDPVSQEVFSTACDELWTQSITAEQFCAKVQKAIDNYLKK